MVSQTSPARMARRAHILEAARALVGSKVSTDFDAVRADLCAIDVVMVAGMPWLKDGMERDFLKDEAGYRKLGGSANTPEQAYFFRSGQNLIHYLKRAGFYVPRGGPVPPTPGMACFFDWEDRGRYNFTPDRSGVVLEAEEGQVKSVVIATEGESDAEDMYIIRRLEIAAGSDRDIALIGYSDLP